MCLQVRIECFIMTFKLLAIVSRLVYLLYLAEHFFLKALLVHSNGYIYDI